MCCCFWARLVERIVCRLSDMGVRCRWRCSMLWRRSDLILKLPDSRRVLARTGSDWNLRRMSMESCVLEDNWSVQSSFVDLMTYLNLPSFCNFRQMKLFRCVFTSADALAPAMTRRDNVRAGNKWAERMLAVLGSFLFWVWTSSFSFSSCIRSMAVDVATAAAMAAETDSCPCGSMRCE